jgi:hypothetical protein
MGRRNGIETICTSTKRASVDGGLFNSGDLKLGIERNAFEGKMLKLYSSQHRLNHEISLIPGISIK